MHEDPEDLPVYRVGGKYRIMARIGIGSFGIVYSARNIITQEQVAVKLEAVGNSQKLRQEWAVYQDIGPASCVPQVFAFYTESGYRALVMEHLGPSVEELFNACGRKFSTITVLSLGIQMVSSVEHLHSRGYIHRDIKPDNFVIGRESPTRLYILDFGLTSKCSNADRSDEDGGVLGTARYCSINAHQCLAQSYRDDMESIVYVLVYLLRGSLPWQNLEARTRKTKFRHIMQRKMKISANDLFLGLPRELLTFFKYVHGLDFMSIPDYQYLRSLLAHASRRLGHAQDGSFDSMTTTISATTHKFTPSNPYPSFGLQLT